MRCDIRNRDTFRAFILFSFLAVSQMSWNLGMSDAYFVFVSGHCMDVFVRESVLCAHSTMNMMMLMVMISPFCINLHTYYLHLLAYVRKHIQEQHNDSHIYKFENVPRPKFT